MGMKTEDTENLPTLFDPSTLVRKGFCPVIPLFCPPGEEKTHSLYFEQHGRGTEFKFLFIMGLSATSFSWKPQVEWFGGGKALRGEGEREKSTALVFDNRGCGYSGYPGGRYTTEQMAEDTVCLLNHVGWTDDRCVHIVGVSLGGMVAEELAMKIPNRIASLTLAVTTAGGMFWNNLPTWTGCYYMAKGLFISDISNRVNFIFDMYYSQTWLREQNEDQPGKTNRQVEAEALIRRLKMAKPQELMGVLGQMAAALTHRVAPQELQRISRRVPKVTIVTGDEDFAVNPRNSRWLKEYMPEAELVEWVSTGHAICSEQSKKMNELIERTALEAKAKNVR